jgi:arylsulfatase A-like enzyme
MAQRNILLVTTDQQRYDSLGGNGGTIARTPTIDGLAARGINYRRAYTQNVTCTPARATILTGRLPRTHGAISCGRSLRDDIPSIASHLHQAAGYRTALLGKAHFDPAMDPFAEFAETRLGVSGSTGPLRGFEHAELAMHGPMASTHYGAWLRAEYPEVAAGFAVPLSPAESPATGAPECRPNPVPRELYHTDWIADRTIAWLDGLPNADPWFCWVSFPDPHHPWDPPEAEMRRVDWRDLELPPGHPGSDDDVARVLAQKPAHWLAYWEGRFANCEGAPSTFVPSKMSHDAIREINARAHVMNELVDEAAARVLSSIAARGWSDRTDVFFTTDHGELQGDFGLVYKGPFHTDALMRLPFVWAPAPDAGIAPAALDDPVGQLDLAPTFCAIAGIDPPDGIDGAPLPTAPGSGRERVICEWDSILPGYGMHMRSMYRDGWLVTAYEPSTVGTPNGFEEFLTRVPVGLAKSLDLHSTPIGPRTTIEYDGTEGELYRLDDDPHAFVNRWDDPQYKAIRTDLVADLRDSLPDAVAPSPVRAFA